MLPSLMILQHHLENQGNLLVDCGTMRATSKLKTSALKCSTWSACFVEAFFLNDRTEHYLEVELCPHGQHLVLLLSGRRGVWKDKLPLEFEVTRMKTKWEGKAHLPWNYFPPCTNKFNAFAIHGSGEERKYEALYPVPRHELQEGQKPDFHRLEFFKDLNLKGLMGEDWKQPESDIWKFLTN
ncbi:UPF0462 protein C4orf33 homolog isoform X2 [Balearica regulorum gibbericeps]|uniref:UPF0462 protein C4orf33 homolog isoform X2 n=1 Tax=Balearica regulorum gibbericeps TaxID=100784 RepID=UPI003F62CF70